MVSNSTLPEASRAGLAAQRTTLADQVPLASGVSWTAIFAGATGAAALSLILLILGVGLGLSAVSPFTAAGVTATTFGVSTIVWITFTQIAASGMGGYLAGRLRTRWASTHTDEVYFRDTAHGFLAWAIATLATAAMLTSAVGSILGTTASTAGALGGAATTAVAAGAGSATPAKAGNMANDDGYFVDTLFRKDATSAAPAGGAPAPTPSDAAVPTAEAGRIFANGLAGGTLSSPDARYLGQLVSQRTGLSQADADKRVNDTFAQAKAKADQAKAEAKDAADKARKASAYASLWLFVSLLAGAFVASLLATFGGRQRDLV